ncbi:MAG: hypothetical protein GY716_08395 [bacterium]|nr:hypothetical protein [bacterium]
MFLRCGKCHASLWLHTDGPPSTCNGCGQTYDSAGYDHDTMVGLRAHARAFAMENGIDMPAAASVMLGLLTLAQVQDVGRAPQPEPDASATPRSEDVAGTPPAVAEESDLTIQFDPAFVPAVEEGCLTRRMAIERGDRDNFANRLVQRHGLSLAAALDVTDNRTTLLCAIRLRGRQARPQARTIEIGMARPPRGRRRALVAVLLFGLLMSGVGGARWLMKRTDAGPAEAVEVRTDEQGRVVQVRGPNPQAVLQAYCKARPTRESLEPLGLMPSVMATTRVRVGVLRDPSQADTLLAIAIRRPRDDSRWSAGDGRAPLIAMQAPDGAATTLGVMLDAGTATP